MQAPLSQLEPCALLGEKGRLFSIKKKYPYQREGGVRTMIINAEYLGELAAVGKISMESALSFAEIRRASSRSSCGEILLADRTRASTVSLLSLCARHHNRLKAPCILVVIGLV
eukprot:6196547-Pleurochrysis_carterae.AAC.2